MLAQNSWDVKIIQNADLRKTHNKVLHLPQPKAAIGCLFAPKYEQNWSFLASKTDPPAAP
jgi:hypothetical protein